jgi:hypothetical protein
MAYEQRDNSGSLFKNDKREHERQPEYTGKIMVDGKMYWLSGWIKDGAKGKFFSLATKLMDQQPGQQRSQPAMDYGRPAAPAPRAPARNGQSPQGRTGVGYGAPDDEIPF